MGKGTPRWDERFVGGQKRLRNRKISAKRSKKGNLVGKKNPEDARYGQGQHARQKREKEEDNKKLEDVEN